MQQQNSQPNNGWAKSSAPRVPQQWQVPFEQSAAVAPIKAYTFFDETQLPSCIRSNMKPEEELLKRIKTCRFIEEASRILRLPRVAISTAMVFIHRFYAVHSFADHDRFEVAVACILIAAKTEESPRKLASVIQECWRLKNSARKSTPILETTGPGSAIAN